MAHSVEGRFPFLDSDVMEFCNGMPSHYKLVGLNEKIVLKRVAKGLVPDSIVKRPKQPYRAPNAISFVQAGAPDYVGELMSEEALRDAGIFDVAMARGLYLKCVRRAGDSRGEDGFSNADNMGLVGLLSTQLIHHQFIRHNREPMNNRVTFKTSVDRLLVPLPQ